MKSTKPPYRGRPNDPSRQARRNGTRKAHRINDVLKIVGYDNLVYINSFAYTFIDDENIISCLRALYAKSEQAGNLNKVDLQGMQELVSSPVSHEGAILSSYEPSDEENSAAALGYLLALDAQACGIDYLSYLQMYDAGEVSLSHYGSATTPPVKPGNGLGPAPQTLCLQTDGGSSAG
jgi:hypothetical protein